MIMRNLFLASTALVSVTAPALSQQVPAQPAPALEPAGTPSTLPQTETNADADAEIGEDIVVVGQRERGSVPGDIQAEQVLRPADIRAYGAGSLTDLLAELGPQLGSGRGQAGGQPVVLLNGRRISGFREIANYPPEAIERVDILPPEAAQQLGFNAEQRVINFVLRRRFNAVTAEVEGGGATQGDRFSTDIDASLLRIQREKRFNLALEYDAQTPVYEADRTIIPTSPGRPYAIAGNISPTPGATQIDPALSALAGAPVTLAGVPAGVTGVPTLGAFLGGANPSQFSNFRTLSPATQDYKATASYARPLFGKVDAALTGSFDVNRSQSELGLAAASLTIPGTSPVSPFADTVVLDRYLIEGGPRRREVESSAGQLGVALNGDIARWRWSVTGNYNRNLTNTVTDNNFDLTPITTRIAARDATLNPFARFSPALLGDYRRDIARSLSNVINGEAQVNGPLLALPAGDVRTSVRAGFVTSDLSARSTRNGVTTLTDVGRDIGNGQVRVDVPIANRGRGVLSAIGNLSANAAYAFEQVSDFGWLSTYSGGVNWSPVPQRLSLLATVSRDANAPSINQLGDPQIITPDARVFDFVRGTSVDVTRIDGGNPLLRAPERRVTNLTLNARPFTSLELNLTAEYTKTRTINPIQTLSTPTAQLEAAFPDRFLRDATGQLIRVDNRPVNVDRLDQEQLRWGFNFSRRIGPAAPAGGGRFAGFRSGAAGGAARPQRTAPDAAPGATGPVQTPTPGAPAGATVVVTEQAAPPLPEGGGGRRFGGPGGGGGRGFGGRGGFGGGNAEGRLQVSIFHTWRFQDTLRIGPGIPVIDRLNGDATDIVSGPRKHQVDFNTGIGKGGYNLRLDGRWQSGTFVRGGTLAAPTDLTIAPLTTVRLRSFVSFTPTMKVARDHPWLVGTRVELSVANLFDTRPRVRDATGTLPINYQPDLLDPIGRTVTLSLRKLFFSRPVARGGALRGAGN